MGYGGYSRIGLGQLDGGALDNGGVGGHRAGNLGIILLGFRSTTSQWFVIDSEK